MASFADEVMLDTPQSWWRCGEISGDFLDSGSAGKTASLFSTSAVTRGVAGLLNEPANAALYCNSVSGLYVPAATANGAYSVSVASYEVIVRIDALGMHTLITLDDGGYRHHQFRLNNGKVEFIAFCTNGSIITSSTPTSIALGWHHIVATVSTTAITIYIDGKSAVTTTIPAAMNTSKGASLKIAAQEGGAGTSTLPGVLDEAVVYTSALSSDRVLAHYNGISTPSTTQSTQNITCGALPI